MAEVKAVLGVNSQQSDHSATTDLRLAEPDLKIIDLTLSDISTLAEALSKKPIEIDPSLGSYGLNQEQVSELKQIRQLAFHRLEQIALNQNNPKQKEAVIALIDVLPQEGSVAQKSALCSIILKNPEFADTLFELMADPFNREVRNYAGGVLKHLIKKFPELADDLMDRIDGKIPLKNEKGYFQDEAICLALMDLPNERSIKYISGILNGPHEDQSAKLMAKIALSKISH
jgi:hypothetical protein